MGDPAYLITRDPELRNSPTDARTRLRADGFSTFAEAVKAAETNAVVSVSYGTVKMASDAVCAMIGNTPELVPGSQKAWKDGYSELEASDGSALSVYYNRYRVSGWQTDTILMIGSLTGYWSGVNVFTNGWSQPNPWAAANITYFFDENPDGRSNLKVIPEALRWIKHQEG